jgi:hypothetical protein
MKLDPLHVNKHVSANSSTTPRRNANLVPVQNSLFWARHLTSRQMTVLVSPMHAIKPMRSVRSDANVDSWRYVRYRISV